MVEMHGGKQHQSERPKETLKPTGSQKRFSALKEAIAHPIQTALRAIGMDHTYRIPVEQRAKRTLDRRYGVTPTSTSTATNATTPNYDEFNPMPHNQAGDEDPENPPATQVGITPDIQKVRTPEHPPLRSVK